MERYVIHACPDRMWYVDGFLLPSLLEQGICRDDILIWNDEERKGNLWAAMECFEEGFNDAVTVLSLPPYLQKYFRTTNHIERLNAELKRRSKVIGVFPNEASLLRLMGSVLEERHTATQTKSRAMFTYATYKAYMGTEMPLELLRIASNQHTLLAA